MFSLHDSISVVFSLSIYIGHILAIYIDMHIVHVYNFMYYGCICHQKVIPQVNENQFASISV